MHTYENDFSKLYQFQLNFLKWVKKIELPFYLTGGTALSRFYLNHRYSDDLDFFANNIKDFKSEIVKIRKSISNHFKSGIQESLFSDDFCRFFITDGTVNLKIEFVNDLNSRPGEPIKTKFGFIDTAENILANKITAIMGRDEPKDVYDIIFIADAYSFNWTEVFLYAKEKAVINEIEVEQRLQMFPPALFKRIKTTNPAPCIDVLKTKLNTICNDFLLGKDNSLCKTNIRLSELKPGLIK